MKKTLICVLVSLFSNIESMEYKSKIKNENLNLSPVLTIPDEIRLYIFETAIKDIIDNNNIFDLSNNVKETICNITLANKEFYNLKYDLVKFAEKYIREIKEKLILSYKNLSQEEKDYKLKSIFINMEANNNEELEVEAAKLIIAGANPALFMYHGIFLSRAPLLMIIARVGKFKNLVKLLIKYGADINSQDDSGYTPLIDATLSEDEGMVELFISEGADVNVKDNNGDTALIWAARNGYTGIVKLLINAGADVNIKDKYGHTALTKAEYKGYVVIVKLLINAGADMLI